MSDASPLILRLDQSGVLKPEDHDVLAALCAKPRAVEANTILVSEGECPSGVRVVLEGFVYRYKILEDGQRQIIGILVPGDLCDLQSVILGRSDHFIATLSDCTLVTVDQDTVDDLTYTRSRIARAFWWSTLVDESILREWLANMGQRSADKWLAHFLCEVLVRLQIVGHASANSCEVPLTQEQLGDVLGISSVHVNRVLKELRDANLLEFRNRRFSVPDLDRLHAFCDFDPNYLHLASNREGSAFSWAAQR